MIRVTNSTPEPDGSSKDYWIRVDPQCQTAHEAAAWTFGKNIKDYRPVHQT